LDALSGGEANCRLLKEESSSAHSLDGWDDSCGVAMPGGLPAVTAKEAG
jgi:hypothetical protein